MPYDKTRDQWTDGNAGGVSDPPRSSSAVVLSDTVDLARYARALWIGVAGDVKVILVEDDDDSARVYTVPQGVFPLQVRRVFLTGTTAANIVVLH